MSSPNPPPPNARPLSLATRLSLWYGAWALLLLAAATGFLYWALCNNLDREDDEFLADKVRFLGVLLDSPRVDAHLLQEEVEWEPAARQYGQVYVRLVGEGGGALMETPGMAALLPLEQFPPSAPLAALRGVDVTRRSGATFRVMAAAVTPKQAKARAIQVAIDRTHEERLLESYRRALWLVLAIALVICVLAGQRIARRGLRPVADMADTARRIRSTTLHERMDTAGLPAELESLAATFNEMLGRLQESFERLARFSADIAHELRNPVNNLRGEAEVALGRPRSPEEYREVLASSLEECARLSRLIDNLLFVARAEDPQTQIVKEAVDVGGELEAVRDFYGAAAAEAGVSLQVRRAGAVTARLDRTLFQRAVGNLVANSLAHTPAGGEIVVAACRKNGGVDVEVRDSGSGIAREHLPHVFDRFYRADPARTAGSSRVGLGLAIVKAIAALHRGSVAVSSEPGKGTLVSLHFPNDEE
jgi:two-component system heavy metal sensor histidine kinase CusS